MGGDFAANKVGAYTFFNGNTYVRHVGSIGRFCMVAPNVTMGMVEHSTKMLSGHIMFENYDVDHFMAFCNYLDEDGFVGIRKNRKNLDKEAKPLIEIGNDVWIGCNVTILRGVKIGDGAVIAAGSVVTKNVEPYTIVGGVPARFIRNRFDVKAIARLLELQWWNYGPEIMKGIDLSNINEALDILEERKKSMKVYSCYRVNISGKTNEVKIIAPE